MATTRAPQAKLLPLSAKALDLNVQFLRKLQAQQPASIPALNEGILVKWNVEAAANLLGLGQIAECGFDPKYGKPKYVVTEAGREELAALGLVRPQRKVG